METILRLVALLGAAAHVYFFFKEAIEWNENFVKDTAPSWIAEARQDNQADRFLKWTKPLAINMGSYNLILAFGLLWITIAGGNVAGSLGIFMAFWLIGAAAAAVCTHVLKAALIQGGLGMVLLILALASR